MYTFYIFTSRISNPSNHIDCSVYEFSTCTKRASICEYFEYSNNYKHGQPYLFVKCTHKAKKIGSTDKLFYYPNIFYYRLYESLDECLNNHFTDLL